MELRLIIHGRGNAWPVFLGDTHPFYDRTSCRDLSNAAYSLVLESEGKVVSDILVDAGHGTVQSLISGENRIPDCICLTHGHLDHTLGIDWVVQSYRRTHPEAGLYPLYASAPVLALLLRAYPQLRGHVAGKPLPPAGTIRLVEAPDLSLTRFPVFHGAGAPGASMLLFRVAGKKVLFTGDLLLPLLRNEDYDQLKGVDLVVVDTNNRFPWPGANHWSFSGHPRSHGKRSDALLDFLDSLEIEEAIGPHQAEDPSPETRHYFETIRREWSAEIPGTILEFLSRIGPLQVACVHYSGMEDARHYGEPLLSGAELHEWIERTGAEAGIDARFRVPEAGSVIRL